MNSIMFEKIGKRGDVKSQGGIRPLFGFAVSDYIEHYDIKDSSIIEGDYIFGAVLDKDDITDKLLDLIAAFIAYEENLSMIIFDINNITDDDIVKLKDYLESLYFTELKDVYEDRIVFVCSPYRSA
jgi:hypothetical protein